MVSLRLFGLMLGFRPRGWRPRGGPRILTLASRVGETPLECYDFFNFAWVLYGILTFRPPPMLGFRYTERRNGRQRGQEGVHGYPHTYIYININIYVYIYKLV